MKKIRGLQLLVYMVFGLLIVHDVLPDAIRGFTDGWNDGYNQSHGNKTRGQLIPAVLTIKNLAGANNAGLKIADTYTLQNVRINADVLLKDNPGATGVTVAAIILVLAVAVVLMFIAYHINMVIVNIANGDIFETVCIHHIRRAGILLCIYSIIDVVYQRVCFAQLTSVIHGPMQVVNTTTFNFPVLICAILAFIMAEAFKKGATLKAEQDLTI